jgi:hypothetical protein
MKIQYRIFELKSDGCSSIPVLSRFARWDDTFDTKEECMGQIKEYGNKFNTYTIIEYITFE